GERGYDGLGEEPMVGHRLRPERIDLEARRLDGASLSGGSLLEERLGDPKNAKQCENARTNQKSSYACSMRHRCALSSGDNIAEISAPETAFSGPRRALRDDVTYAAGV